jgi:hypothetical protein
LKIWQIGADSLWASAWTTVVIVSNILSMIALGSYAHHSPTILGMEDSS